jgi:hypothetical protein
MKTPRIIAIEPTAMQYAQQSILHLIQESIKSSYLDGFIGLRDQTPNQRLAHEGSRTSELATLDLSEASDRVSLETVSLLLHNHRHFHDAAMDCRSTTALMPSGEVLTLAKYASMGSALCFPMEAMTFLVAVFLGIERDLGHPLTLQGIQSYEGRVRIFGDDIIVPRIHVRSVIQALEDLGLQVNDRKSFWNGKFRESCGKEFYDGWDVSVVRCRRSLPSSRKNVQEIISLVSFRNQLFSAGFEKALGTLDSRLVRILRYFPVVSESSPVLGRLSYDSVYCESKLVHSIPMVKGWMIRPVIPVNEISDWPALRKCLAALNGRQPGFVATSPDHLRRSGRPRVVDIKLGMGHIGY